MRRIDDVATISHCFLHLCHCSVSFTVFHVIRVISSSLQQTSASVLRSTPVTESFLAITEIYICTANEETYDTNVL